MNFLNWLRDFIPKVIYLFHLDFIFSYRSYSQDGEDMMLASFFDNQKRIFNFGNKGYRGFYVDVGGYHPYRYSNTAFFYNKKWKGMNIEPIPVGIREFRRKRKKDINLNIGISDYCGEMLFHEYNDPALNTFDEKMVLYYNKTNPDAQLLKKTNVPVLTLEEMFNKYLPKNQNVDFMSIDVEGLDLRVLQSNDWDVVRPNYLLVEIEDHMGVDIKKVIESDIYKFLEKKEYILVGKVFRTGLFKCKRFSN